MVNNVFVWFRITKDKVCTVPHSTKQENISLPKFATTHTVLAAAKYVDEICGSALITLPLVAFNDLSSSFPQTQPAGKTECAAHFTNVLKTVKIKFKA